MRIGPLSVTSVTLTALIALGAATANAETITFGGTSSGCFNCASGGSPTATVGGLTFDASVFTGIAADASGSALIDLGIMTLDSSAYNYSRNHTTFLLNVMFSDPANLTGSYGAQIQGSVNLLGNGSVNVQLDKSFQTYSFSNAAGYGSFDFGMLDPTLHLKPGDTLTLWGVVQALQYTATPSGGATGGTQDPVPPGGETGGQTGGDQTGGGQTGNSQDPLPPGGETGGQTGGGQTGSDAQDPLPPIPGGGDTGGGDTGTADGPSTPVPEPALIVLAGVGVAAALRRRRNFDA